MFNLSALWAALEERPQPRTSETSAAVEGEPVGVDPGEDRRDVPGRQKRNDASAVSIVGREKNDALI